MTDTLELSRQLNACIKDSDVYKNYQYCKDKLRQKPEKLQQLMEFRKKIMKYRITKCLTIHMMKLIIYSWNMTP